MEKLIQKALQDPNAIIALSALMLSIISVLLAYLTIRQNRTFNRLSVRPLAYILPDDYENRIAVVLQNKGTGPLITKSLFFVDSKGNKKKHLIDFMPPLQDGLYWNTFTKSRKIILEPSEKKILLEFSTDILNEKYINQRDIIRKSLSDIEIKLEYTSIYEEKKPFELNFKLTWYSRI